jgi:hypothetical protein
MVMTRGVSGVVSNALATRSLGGMEQQGLADGRVMFDLRRARVLSGVMVAGMMRIMRICVLNIARWFNGGDGFCIECTRRSLRVC